MATMVTVGYGLLVSIRDQSRAGTRHAGVWLAAYGAFPAPNLNVTWLLINQGGDSKKEAGLAIFLTLGFLTFGQCSSLVSSTVFPQSDA